MPKIAYSVVVPAHNEEGTIRELYTAVRKVLDGVVGEGSPLRSSSFGGHAGEPQAASAQGSGEPQWELIFVDDGSSDGTYRIMEELQAADSRVRLIRFRRNFGQTAAWSAGFDAARGDYVIVMDADLQNDPRDIPAMLSTMRAEGYDVISGWRKDRKDDGIMTLGSKIGNWVHRWMTGEKIHDHGCSLKIYRREALEDLELYGEMHRYITALLSWKGFRVGEMVVRHHPRRHGTTNYSIRKKLKGFLDLVIVKFWVQYSARPMHFFGTIGAAFIGAGFVLGGTLGVLWIFRIIGLANRSTPLLAVLLVLLGFQFLFTGVLADVVAHTYYATKKAYSIKETRGFEREE